MDYFAKVEKKPEPDLVWNIPEQKYGIVKIVGGNSQNFRTVIKTAEFMTKNYPIERLTMVLPDSLRKQLPELPDVIYIGATESGSFEDAGILEMVMARPDYNLLIGDLSKNAKTAQVVGNVLQNLTCPTVVTRDAVDLVAETKPEQILLNSKLIYFATMPQLVKLLRAVYYPKMLLLTQSLMQVADVLHKFTLSYPIKIVTLHNEQILVAENGMVKVVPLAKSGYLPMFFWQGEMAAKITMLNLYNPNKFIDATLCAIFA
ncbi:hypothetical protein IKG05_00820 [Candidatus Saccharibacteria bacterium]|nr:hypothetical protein [Candidatus Saccharibacteria bacterium]